LTDSRHTNPVAENRLDRTFTATEPHQKWVGDMTGIPTAQGWLYLAVILDLYSRLVVGWFMSAHRDETLVECALEMALLHRHPQAGLFHYTDRGSQYTSCQYREELAQAEMAVRMSRKANCWDNAPMESFFGTLKTEWVDRHSYRTHAEARLSIFEYIETFYNRKRRHSTLGYLSPVAYEHQESGKEEGEKRFIRLT